MRRDLGNSMGCLARCGILDSKIYAFFVDMKAKIRAVGYWLLAIGTLG
jgi:hypothetical protein